MRVRVAAAILLGMTIVTASSAFAVASPDGGGRAVWAPSGGGTFYVADDKCDGRSVYGNWGGTSDNRYENKAGCNTVVSRTVSRPGRIRACTNVPVGSDSCSGWVNP